MGTSKKKEQKPKQSNPPEQKLGDTPAPPWEMATPEEKEQAKPIRRALKEAVAKVDSPEKAEKVIEKLEASTADQKVEDVTQAQPPLPTPARADGASPAEPPLPRQRFHQRSHMWCRSRHTP